MEDGNAMIDIIYEDNHLLIIDKPINIPTQKDVSNDISIQDLLKDYLRIKYNKPGNVYLGTVQRLDRPVGGLMVFTKTSKAAERLTNQIKNHELIKTYYAVVNGKTEEKDTLIDKLLKDPKTNLVKVSKNGKEALLDYELIKYKNDYSLVKINLKTGRSHQIRVQFASRNHPLYGDQKYNKNAKVGQQIALFSKRLEFIHPITKENLIFEIELPKRYPFTD